MNNLIEKIKKLKKELDEEEPITFGLNEKNKKEVSESLDTLVNHLSGFSNVNPDDIDVADLKEMADNLEKKINLLKHRRQENGKPRS